MRHQWMRALAVTAVVAIVGGACTATPAASSAAATAASPAASSAAATAASPAASSAAATAAPSGKQITIGAFYLDAQGFYGGIAKGIEIGAQNQNMKLLSNNSNSDITVESNFMGTVIAAKVDAIIMSPVSDTASVASVKLAFGAGIPVICYNTCINAADAQKYVKALVTTDQKGYAAVVGSYAGDYFIKKGIAAPKVAILNCDLYEACQERKAGFKAALLAKVPGAQIVADQTAYVVDKQTTIATDILTAHPDLDAFYSTVEGIGAVQAILATNRTGKTVVFGQDISQQGAQLMRDHQDIYLMVDAQIPQEMGKYAVQDALKIVSGQPPAQYLTLVPTQVYTSDNKAALEQWFIDHADAIP